jgi:hypothetical protein
VLNEQLDRLHQEFNSDTYQPRPLRRHLILKAGQPGKFRPLRIPTIYDWVCQQALPNRLEPIFDDGSFGGAKGDRPRMSCERSGRSWARVLSGSWTPISKIPLGQIITKNS